MLLIAENIPATSEMVPLIGIYLTITMSLTSISIILTVFVLQLHHGSQFEFHLSRNFYDFVTKRIAFIVGLRHTVRTFELKNQTQMDEQKGAKLEASNTNNNFNSERIGTGSGSFRSHRLKPFNLSQTFVRTGERDNQTNKFIFKYQPYTKTFLSVEKVNGATMNDKCKCPEAQSCKSINMVSSKIKGLKKKQMIKDIKTRILIGEWKLVSLIIDRFLFWIFTTLTALSTILLLLVIPILKNKEII